MSQPQVATQGAINVATDVAAHPADTLAGLLRARYGANHAPVLDAAGLNDTLATILGHRSVRAYLPTPLPPGTLDLIVAAAQSAPSSSNLQVWSVIAVEDEARKARLAGFAGGQKHIEQAPLFLVWLADLARLQTIGREAGHETTALDYLESLIVAVVDAALAAQNALVALESLGLGSVYIGAIRNRPEEVAAELGLPPNVLAVFGLCVGYADPAAQAAVKPRLPQRVVVHKERYEPSVSKADISGYDETLGAFQAGQGLPAVGWTAAALERVRNSASLKGRDRLVEALKGFGFGLK